MEVNIYGLIISLAIAFLLTLLVTSCLYLLAKLTRKLINPEMWPFKCCSKTLDTDYNEPQLKKQDWPGSKELAEMFIQSLDEWDRYKVPHAIDYEKRTVKWNQMGSKCMWKRRSPAMLAMFNKDLWKFFPTRSCETMIDWNFQDHDRNSAPMLAVIENDVECVRMLSKIEGINWNTRNFGCWPRNGVHDNDSIYNITSQSEWYKDDCLHSESPLTWALKRNYSEIVQILLSIPTVDIINRRFYWIMMPDAVLNELFKQCKLFVSNMIEKSSDEITVTPLIFALRKNLRSDIIKVLVYGAKNADILDLVLHWKCNTESDVKGEQPNVITKTKKKLLHQIKSKN